MLIFAARCFHAIIDADADTAITLLSSADAMLLAIPLRAAAYAIIDITRRAASSMFRRGFDALLLMLMPLLATLIHYYHYFRCGAMLLFAR